MIGRDIFPDLSLDPNAFKCYKAPIIIKYRIANQAETVYNPENPIKGQNAPQHSFILTGIQSEEWPIAPDTFYETYDIKKSLNNLSGYDGNGLCAKRKMIVHSIELNIKTQVKVSWSDAILTGHYGDYLVQYKVEDYGIVQREIFNKTYIVDPNEKSNTASILITGVSFIALLSAVIWYKCSIKK